MLQPHHALHAQLVPTEILVPLVRYVLKGLSQLLGHLLAVIVCLVR